MAILKTLLLIYHQKLISVCLLILLDLLFLCALTRYFQITWQLKMGTIRIFKRAMKVIAILLWQQKNKWSHSELIR
ncbi:hypothetical protein DC487_09700 [Sphingobacterium corticibacter]|uniref:Uncharacterized protein n=1 Tax=Sphingobacterium corticibacter TaxID=2171749 RepID=A0A2T8HIH6_9SPHI|nr:hypothetical protein DC487_09700 [Sphingobacterium corticibacter]